MVLDKAKVYKVSLCSKKKHKKQVTALMVAIAAAVITHHITPSLFPTPINTSTLTGMGWLRELLTGHPVRFYDTLGVPKHVFRKLVHELELHASLKHSKHICAPSHEVQAPLQSNTPFPSIISLVSSCLLLRKNCNKLSRVLAALLRLLRRFGGGLWFLLFGASLCIFPGNL
jgi:hypothetical protein